MSKPFREYGDARGSACALESGLGAVRGRWTCSASTVRSSSLLSRASLLRLAEGLEMNPAKLVDGLRWVADAPSPPK